MVVSIKIGLPLLKWTVWKTCETQNRLMAKNYNDDNASEFVADFLWNWKSQPNIIVKLILS